MPVPDLRQGRVAQGQRRDQPATRRAQPRRHRRRRAHVVQRGPHVVRDPGRPEAGRRDDLRAPGLRRGQYHRVQPRAWQGPHDLPQDPQLRSIGDRADQPPDVFGRQSRRCRDLRGLPGGSQGLRVLRVPAGRVLRRAASSPRDEVARRPSPVRN